MNSERQWRPAGRTVSKTTLEVGDVLGLWRAVFKVLDVRWAELNDDDHAAWVTDGLPPLETWHNRPYNVDLQILAGPRPVDWGPRRERCSFGFRGFTWWHVYLDGRWPQCSCCGEPMPCRGEEEDDLARAAVRRLDDLAAIGPEQCWGCKAVITGRQRSITYPGENLDMPGAACPRFHYRSNCRTAAREYEHRWLAADPRRERVITYPDCGGALVVHADATTSCEPQPEITRWTKKTRLPDCTGHLDADHGTTTTCYGSQCPRGCDSSNGPWYCNVVWQPPRQPRNQPEQELF